MCILYGQTIIVKPVYLIFVFIFPTIMAFLLGMVVPAGTTLAGLLLLPIITSGIYVTGESVAS
jgi:hypothetical protein